MNNVLLLENNILEVDYCRPVPGGLLIYMTGQYFKKIPFGKWKKYDSSGNVIEEFSENHLDNIYRIIEKENN